MKSYFSRRLAAATVILAASLASNSSEASGQWTQNSPQKNTPQQTSSSQDRNHVIFTNPFGILYGMYTAEYEGKINQSLSVAISGTVWENLKKDDFRFNSINAALRFYPMERPLRGFSISPTLGIVSFKESPDPCVVTPSETCNDKKTTNATFGFQIDYGWLMGPSQRFAVGTGLGAKRVLGSTGGDTKFIPAARFQIGYAF